MRFVMALPLLWLAACGGTELATTRADRCQAAQTALLAARTISDDEKRQERIEVYQELIGIWCA